MNTLEKVVLWVGIISLVILVGLTVLYLLYRRQGHHKIHKILNEKLRRNSGTKSNTKQNSKPVQSFEAKSYTSNPLLDGARVSHRRSHPDRIEEENYWEELKERENSEIQRKLELDRKNQLLMIFSPCNADVVTIHENEEEAQEDGYENPGVILIPSDDKIYAPMNGIVSWEETDGSLRVTSDTGTEVLIEAKIKASETEIINDCFEKRVKNGASVCMGEMIGQFHSGIIKRNNKTVVVRLELTSYKKEQLILMKHANYVSHGDKVMTIRLES
ncbi:MAG: PTS glucose transporter subunit IIA [Clostridiales bacterium]|nr:PTS glucose transporter subunit IIA [Clostridiales bacterium]